MIRALLTTARLPYLVALALATAVLGVFAAQVPTEQSNESMNSFSPEERATYAEFRRRFGSDEDLVLSVTHPQLLGPEGIGLLDALTERAGTIDGVRRVYSLSNAIELAPGPDGAVERGLLPRPIAGADYAARARRAAERNPELAGFLMSADLSTAAVLVEIEIRPGDDDYRPRILGELRALMDELGEAPAELHLTGIDAQKFEVTRLLERDQSVLIPASVGVLAIVLAVIFRRLSGVVIPLAVTGVALVWTLGCYGWSGNALNTMTSLLPPVLMVLSVSSSVHLYESWLSRRGASEDPNLAIEAVVLELRRPCFFTSLTTALGMLSLVVSDTPAVRLFGAFTALGVMISFAVSLTLVPVLLSFVPPPAAPPAGRRGGALAAGLQLATRASVRHPTAILGLAGLLTLAGLAGISQIRSNTDLVRFLKPNDRLFVDSMFIDRQLAGINTLEFVLSRPDGASLASPDAMERLDRFRQALLAHPEVGSVQSVLSLLSAIQRAETHGEGWQLPVDEADLLYAFDLLEEAGDDDLVRRVIDPEFRHARVRAQIHSLGTALAAPLEDRILAEAHAIFGDDYAFAVTGAFHQMARDSNRLVEKQVESFSLAFVLVILAVGVMFRSAHLMVLSIIPNVIPIVWTGGLMGALGIELSTGTTMIASVVIGLAVDDTIHFLTRFRRESDRGVLEAVRTTTSSTGRALVISSVVLVIGFWVGALGSFKPTIYFSLLTGVTMISALLCDLLVLPASLVLWSPIRRASRRRAALLVLPLALATAVAAPPATASQDPLLDRSGDRILQRADIRSRGGKHGEVRLVARGSTRVVQTLLYTKLLRRVLAEIRDREHANWPVDAALSAASARYLAALDRAERTIPLPRIGDHGAAAERRRPLLIEFAVSSSDAAVLLLEPRVSAAEGELTIVDARLIERLDLPRDFVREDMRLIAEEHFASQREELPRLLAPGELAASGGPGSENSRDGER